MGALMDLLPKKLHALKMRTFEEGKKGF